VQEKKIQMLRNEEKAKLSQYSALYDLIIPKENLLRQINDLIDFSFIHEELSSKYCHTNGRTAESPIRLFKYLLLKTIYDASDVNIVERSRYDMSFKYFLNMSPEDEVINSSTLTKFRKLRLQDTDLLNLLINKTVSIALEKNIITTKSIIVDATHTSSKYNRLSAIEVLRERSRVLRKTIYNFRAEMKAQMPAKNTEDDIEKELSYCKELESFVEQTEAISSIVAIQERLSVLKETMIETDEHLTLSKDADARIGYKSSDSPFFGYKTHIAMTEERIITAAVITSGEKGDGQLLPELLKISQNNGLEVETIIGDAAYSGKENLDMGEAENIKIVSKLNPSISQGIRSEKDKFDYNKDAGMFVCPAGHLAIKKARQGKKNVAANQVDTYYFDVEKCKRCAYKEGCYQEGAKTKTYSVSIKSDLHKAQIDFEQTDYFKEKAKERYKIEAKNAELKNVHGYDRAQSSGITNMQMQGAMAIFTVNLKRIIKINMDMYKYID
jgi:transposase